MSQAEPRTRREEVTALLHIRQLPVHINPAAEVYTTTNTSVLAEDGRCAVTTVWMRMFFSHVLFDAP